MPFNVVELMEKIVDLEEEFEKYLSKMKLWICELLRKKNYSIFVGFSCFKGFFFFR
jgi:hypothetical protein